jgi:thiol-disulfide isomerase/thioredoxin
VIERPSVIIAFSYRSYGASLRSRFLTSTSRTASSQPRTLQDFRGRVVLLNLWATWCPPCRKEMLALDRLRAARGDDDFEVVALSVDEAASTRSRGSMRISASRIWRSLRTLLLKSSDALGVIGLPTTLLVDLEGHEVGRSVGAAEWDAPATVAFLNSFYRTPARTKLIRHSHASRNRRLIPLRSTVRRGGAESRRSRPFRIG